MMYNDYAGCYIGIAEEGFPLVCDLYPDGKFIMSTVMDGEATSFALGDYEAEDREFKIPAKKARLMMVLNNKDEIGEIVKKKSLKFSGAITYYAGDAKRTVFPFTIDDDESPLPDSYASSVLNSYFMFDLTKHDFGDLDVDEAIEMAGVRGKENADPAEEEGKDFVPTGADFARLYTDYGKRNDGAYFDKKGNVCYRDVEPRKFITPDEGSKIGDWTNVSYNIEADTAKEVQRVAALNRANRARANGTFDENKDYSVDE